jgi:mannose/fructose-specific phosphotransferase system component IIA
MIGGLVVTHGALGQELARVVSLVLGPVEGLDVLSNRSLGMKELTDAVRAWVRGQGAAGAAGVILFSDDCGGSCANACQLAADAGPPVTVLTGVNLAMLLGFATWRDEMELPELARRLVGKGREAITILGPAVPV